MVESFAGATPVHLTSVVEAPPPGEEQAQPGTGSSGYPTLTTEQKESLRAQLVGTRQNLRARRSAKQNIWDECWQLYRGIEDWEGKDEWQSKVVLPKAWASVKQATSVLKRMLSLSRNPWTLESENQNDILEQLKAEQNQKMLRYFMDKANYVEALAEGWECGFIMGLGVWKVWWGLKPRVRTRIQDTPFQDEFGQMGIQKQLLREKVLEGQLFIRAVDPYNFYWLPGSRLNQWAGTIEDIEVPRWKLLDMAKQGMFDASEEEVKRLLPKKIDAGRKKEYLRHQEVDSGQGQEGIEVCQLTEYFGPLILDGELIEEHGHMVVANDTLVLKCGKNEFWDEEPPYVAFSPLAVPFRTEGIGLIEMVRAINKALNRIANLSNDTLLYKLLPVFEVVPDVYENPEDFDTGLTPGKIFRRNHMGQGQPGIQPIGFEDVSGGTIQVAAMLDRAHQEGALIGEIQQGIPRWRGDQTATEIEIKQQNQDSFFGAMAADIEAQSVKPLVEKGLRLMAQFVDTANDPRVTSLLGEKQELLQQMQPVDWLEMVQGDYKVKVAGITEQLEKADMLQNLVQLMNIVGQNPQAWMAYINQDALLRRILEAFRPAVKEINDIIADPEMQKMKMQQMQQEQLTPQMLEMIPQLMQMYQQGQQQNFANASQMRDQALTEQQMAQQGMQSIMQAQQAAAAKKGTGNE